MAEGIELLGHASVRLTGGGATVYIDPWKLVPGAPAADLVLITHGHYDHCSPDDVAAIAGDETIVMGPPDVAAKLPGARQIRVGETVDLTELGVKVEVVPAYNLAKDFHPRRNEWAGYVVTIGGRRIYHAGDTDQVPEMDSLQVDVALLPVGGTYTMDAVEAARAAEAIGPALACPMHYGDIVGGDADAEMFKRLAPVPVELLPLSRP